MGDGCAYALLAVWAVEAVAWVCLGAIFTLAAPAAGGGANRLTVAGVLFILGAVQLVPAIALFRRRLRLRPSSMEERVVVLAQRSGGRVTTAGVAAEVECPPDEAARVLRWMTQKGLCEPVGQDEWEVRGIAAHKLQRKCPYCGASLPVRDQALVCPQCGANLELTRD
jgi:hypothetical protein